MSLADDCIHGLAAGLCDQCYPKPKPVLDEVAGEPTVGRASSHAATRPRVAPRRNAQSSALSSAQTKRPAVDIGEQRIYHVTHVNNLADILSTGHVLADASEAWLTRPALDISSTENRAVRQGTEVSAGVMVAGYVPFFLSPEAAVWGSIRGASDDPRLSAAARRAAASEFVFLVTTVKTVVDAQGADDGSVAVTDGDAAHVLTRFAATAEATERMLRKLRAEDEAGSIRTAEFLVREELPFELVTLVGVANDKARVLVKSILGESAYGPKVAVYPPWFQPAE